VTSLTIAHLRRSGPARQRGVACALAESTGSPGFLRALGRGWPAPWRRARLGVLVLAAMLFPSVLAAQCCFGCSTPVYRYAMYNWPTAPYYVFYIHHGQVAPEDQPIHELIRKLGEAEPPANLVLEIIDGTDKAQLEQYPQVVIDAWHACDEGAGEPVSLVFTAWGAHLFSGRLDEKNVRALVDSPVRKQIGRLFQEGHGAVLLVLTGPDGKANAQAEKAVEKLAADAAAGKFDFDQTDPYGIPAVESLAGEPGEPYPAESESGAAGQPSEAVSEQAAGEQQEDPQAETAGAEQPEQDSAGFKMGVIKLARDDPKEQWLVRSLLAVEPDLNEFPNEPMVFGIYGRGRALPPFIGKGINYENLVECVYFLMGPCSCMIKDQNPGMDLLMCWNWDKTAEKWMATDEMLAADQWEYDYPLVEEGMVEEEAGTEDVGQSVALADTPPEVSTQGPDQPGRPEPEAVGSGEPDAAISRSGAENSATQPLEAETQVAAAPGGELSVDKSGAESIAKPAADQAPQGSLPPSCASSDMVAGKTTAKEKAAAVRRQVWIGGVLLGGGALLVVALGFVVALGRRNG